MFRFKLPSLPQIFVRGRRRRWVILIVLAIVVAIVAVGGNFVYRKPDSNAAKRFAHFVPYPAALAGGNIVWVSEIFTQEHFTKTYGAKTNQVIPEASQIRSEVLDHLIEVRLVSQEAARNKISVSPKEVDDQFETIASQNGGQEQILQTLNDLYGMNERSFKKLIAEQLLIDKLKSEVLTSVSARHILVKDQNKANELVTKLREGADFTQTAKEQSEDTGSKDAGGSLGFVNRGVTAKPFEDAAFALEVGKISDPVQTEFGWHIILVEEKKGTIDKSYADWLSETKNKTKITKFLTR